MTVDDSFLTKLAAELAKLRLEVATLQTFLAQHTDATLESIQQATEILVQSATFQDVAQATFERLRESVAPP